MAASPFQLGVAELLFIKASDKRRYSSRLSRLTAGMSADDETTPQAVCDLLAMKNHRDEAWLADNYLWAAFVHACGDNTDLMSDTVMSVRRHQQGRDVYIIPQLKLWMMKQMMQSV